MSSASLLSRFWAWLRVPVNALFLLLVLVFAVSQLVLIWQSWFVYRLWEDEAFNLTVPLNLVSGLGYSSDGALSGSELTPFDVRISTGPVVLLPIAAVIGLGFDPVLGGRFVMVLFYALLLAGLWVLGSRIGGRWAALLAVSVPSFLFLAGLPSPVQGPADILGEVPSAALVAWALVLLRRHWLWAALVFGLAIQAKLIALLAAPALVLLLVISAAGLGFWARVLRVVWAGLLAAVPTLLFEFVVLLASGSEGFLEHLRLLASFLRSGGQLDVRSSPGEKLALLFESWFLPAWLTLLLALLGASLLVLLFVLWRRDRAVFDALPRSVSSFSFEYVFCLLAASALGVLTYVIWWMQSVHTPLWIRHPSVGLLVFVPVLAAGVVLALRVLYLRSAARSWARVSILGVAVLFGVAGVFQLGAHSWQSLHPPLALSLADQRVVAEGVRGELGAADDEWVAVLWGEAVAIPVLAGAHVGLLDAPAMVDTPRLLPHTWVASCPVDSVPLGRYVFCDFPLTWDDRP